MLTNCKIGIITYDIPHRKTQELIFRLLLRGYNNIHIIVLPCMDRLRVKPFYQHRPYEALSGSLANLSDMLQFSLTFHSCGYRNLGDYLLMLKCDYHLLAGAGMIPGEVTGKFRIINAHPGYLPNVRGLDALKWAIYLGQPIGVTTHIINEEIDAGLMIERRIITVNFNDTFHSVAHRVWEAELNMLVDAIEHIENKTAAYEPLTDLRYEPNRRMSTSEEIVMMARFEMIRVKSRGSM